MVNIWCGSIDRDEAAAVALEPEIVIFDRR
jgi:hypothetical protein